MSDTCYKQTLISPCSQKHTKESAHQSGSLRGLIIGAGPAGFFTYEELHKIATKEGISLEIDIINRDVRPGGLVVYGVAPDHTKIRSLKDQFEKLLEHQNVRYFGNVKFGNDVKEENLAGRYHFVIYAVGAQSDQHLGIKGESLKGCYTGRAFIAWYNGDPTFAELRPSLISKRVVLVGAGNVAADIARVLVRPIEDLHATDIAPYALSAIEHGHTQEVVVCVRRGPAHVKFTLAEVRALGEINGVDIVVDKKDLELTPDLEELIKNNREAAKNYDIFCSFANRSLTPGNKRITFRFFVSPVGINGETEVESVTLIKNKMLGEKAVAIPGSEETIQTNLIINSVGYKVVPIPGIPYDEEKKVILNEGGRITKDGLPKQYVVGWAADGATGVIGTNKLRARKVVSTLVEDLKAGVFYQQSECQLSPLEHFDLASYLDQKNVRYVNFQDWKKIDLHEVTIGQSSGRPRLRLASNAEMVKFLDETTP